MAQTILISNRELEPTDENGVFVWLNDTGRPTLGALSGFRARGRPATTPVAEEDWISTIKAATALADRSGASAVYVYRV